MRVGTEDRTDAAALREHCRTMLTPDEVPDRDFVVEALPRGAALKVDRRWLLTMLQDLGAKQKHIHVRGIRP